MSRRLEVIPTGFIDYGKAGESFMAGMQQGRNIMMQEEERQRRLKEQENQRLSAANQIYRQNQADLERFGTDLTTAEKLKFTSQFDGIMNMNREMQSWISKGGKVGSPEYNALQDNIEKSKKNLQMNIGAIKEVKGAINEAIALQKNGYIVDGNLLNTLNDNYKNILSGNYVPSIDLPNKQIITQSAYKSPISIYEKFSPKKYTERQKSYKKGNEVITEKSKIPSYDEISASAQNMINLPPSESAGIIKDYQKFKSLADSGLGEFKDRYDIYSVYMQETDNIPKQPKDMNPADYAMMELISQSYIAEPNIISKYKSPEKLSKITQKEEKAIVTNSILTDIFSGDTKKSDDAVDELQGALQLDGYSITKSGNSLTVVKAKDAFDPKGVNITIPLEKNNKKSEATLRTLLKKYMTATGG